MSTPAEGPCISEKHTSPSHLDHDHDHGQSPRESVEESPEDLRSSSTRTESGLEKEVEYGGNDTTNDLGQTTSQSSAGPPHSVFSRRKKQFIVFMTVWAGFISPLSANIYFPALNVLAKDLGVTNGLINLTLTSYMIFQGLAPTFFGDFADMAGRRPAYIIGFTIYIGACVGIALQNSFAALIVLRCVQSTGSSGTVALASGIVADISASSERGKYMGWVTSGMLLGPAIGPVIGGVLSQFLGWRSIFWFLVILVGVLMVPLVVAFPETGRNIVGNGSIPPQTWNVSLLSYLATRQQVKEAGPLERTVSRESIRSERSRLAAQRKLRFPNPFHTLKVFLEKDICLLLTLNSLLYVGFYDVTASTPYLFEQIYGFDELKIGFCYIPLGVGCLVASILNGYIMDWNFRRVARSIGVSVDKTRMTNSEFPYERARIMVAIPEYLVGIAAILCYGWVVEVEAPLAAPLILQFIIGLCLCAVFNVNQVMLVDSYPLQPATATAANNFARCLLGAAGTAVIIQMIDGMGRGWCYTFIAGVLLLTTPIMWILLKWGPTWRRERRQREISAQGIRQ